MYSNSHCYAVRNAVTNVKNGQKHQIQKWRAEIMSSAEEKREQKNILKKRQKSNTNANIHDQIVTDRVKFGRWVGTNNRSIASQGFGYLRHYTTRFRRTKTSKRKQQTRFQSAKPICKKIVLMQQTPICSK